MNKDFSSGKKRPGLKIALAVLLSVVLLFAVAMTAVAYAATMVKVTFIVDGKVYRQVSVESGTNAQSVLYGTSDVAIYGVSWTNDTTTTMARTDDAVGLTYTIDTSAGTIDSDFNNVFPWNKASVVTNDNGKFLQLPDMWFRVGTDSNGDINAVAVSSEQGSEGDWYKVDSFKYGCYGASLNSAGTAFVSVSGVTRASSITRAQSRTYATAAGGYQLDLYHKTVMQFLWWIEWATKDSASIMTGVTGEYGSACNIGGTDSLSTPSGYNTTTKQMRWHYIEDFVGNYYEWVDGISGSGSSSARSISVCATPSQYSDSATATGYAVPSYWNYGNMSSGNCIKAFGWDSANPFLAYVSKTYSSGNYNGGFCDGCWPPYSSFPVVVCGASWRASGAYYGVSRFDDCNVGSAGGGFGARLLA